TKGCMRCGNTKRSLLGKITCAACHHTHFYCRKCIEMGRVMECESLYQWTGRKPIWLKHDSPCTWKGNLTKAQQRAANRIVQSINEGLKELLVWAVCGAGKTEMLFPRSEESRVGKENRCRQRE